MSGSYIFAFKILHLLHDYKRKKSIFVFSTLLSQEDGAKTKDHLHKGHILLLVLIDFFKHSPWKMCPQVVEVAVHGLIRSRHIEQGPDQSR